MARLLVIRHGETAWNRVQRFQGAIDVPLSEEGIREASLLAAHLKDKPLSAVYASTLSRARDTARAIAAPHGLEVVEKPGLGELNIGEWAGMNWKEILTEWPELGRRWRDNPQTSPAPPGGEYYPDFQNRVMEALEQVAAAHGEQELVAVVSHGGAIRTVINRLLGLPWGTRGQFFIRNCSITPMRWQPEGPVIVEGFNDVCHLKDEWR